MGKRIKEDDEFHHLPEPIIHLIQSFLTGKEAAQTTILSKSWHSAWLTLPNLDFDQSDFPKGVFLKFVKKTIERYEKSKLRIERLRLRITRLKKPGRASKLVPTASRIGATNLLLESHVSIYCDKLEPLNWFGGLNDILTELGGSKIHLSLTFNLCRCFDYEPRYLEGLPKHQVENVTLHLLDLPCLICYALFDGLFQLCRPNSITQRMDPNPTTASNIAPTLVRVRAHTRNDFLCETLVRGKNREFSSPSAFMHGVHDLEDVKMELYDEDVAAWRPLPLEIILDGSLTTPKAKKNVRFQLKWKP